ncbi:hypothetical protein [Vampirovibrio sp.]|uniref:hypothetical protein n=1 Tax=Vampirovibrio sp. TaxID=2717857 RepID=UPI0035946915
MKKSDFWKPFYSFWPKAIQPRHEGYSLLLAIPGDLPVFLKIAMEVCSSQNLQHCVELLVTPDQRSEAFRKVFESCRKSWQGPPLRLTELNRFENWLTTRAKNPGTNHWLQIIRGIGASRSRLALLHDADLFITDQQFLKKHYELCTNRQLVCLGVSPAWDGWFADQGYDYLTATWEMLVDVSWVRQWAPWVHRGQIRRFKGQDHLFDTLYWAECHTESQKIARHYGEHGFVHFNYVISTYRQFQKSVDSFEDSRFCLLLIRLLINAFDTSDWPYEIPTIPALIAGIQDSANRVTYMAPETTENYEIFRQKLEQLLNTFYIQPSTARQIRSDLLPFDHHFNFTQTPPVDCPL